MPEQKTSGVLDMLKQRLASAKGDAVKHQDECDNLKAKLAAETKRGDEAEMEVKSLSRRIQLLEDDVRYARKIRI